MSALELSFYTFLAVIMALAIVFAVRQARRQGLSGLGAVNVNSITSAYMKNHGLEVTLAITVVIIALTLSLEVLVTVLLVGFVLGWTGEKRLKSIGWTAFGVAAIMLLHVHAGTWYAEKIHAAKDYLNKELKVAAPPSQEEVRTGYRELDERSRPSAPPKGSRLNPYTLKKGEIIERVFTPGETVYVQMPQHITSCNGQSLTATDLGGALFRYKNETGEKQSSYAFAGPCSKLPPQ